MKKVIISLVLGLGINFCVFAQINEVGKKPIMKPGTIYIESKISVSNISDSFDNYGLKYAIYEFDFAGIDYITPNLVDIFMYDNSYLLGSSVSIKIPYEGTDSVFLKQVRDIILPFAKNYPANVSTNVIIQDYVDSIAKILCYLDNSYSVDYYRYVILDTTTFNVYQQNRRDLNPNKKPYSSSSYYLIDDVLIDDYDNRDLYYGDYNEKPVEFWDYSNNYSYYDREKTIVVPETAIATIFPQTCTVRKVEDNFVYVKQSGLWKTSLFRYTEHWSETGDRTFYFLNKDILVLYTNIAQRNGAFYPYTDTGLDAIVDVKTGKTLDYKDCLIDSNKYAIFPYRYGMEIYKKSDDDDYFLWSFSSNSSTKEIDILTSEKDTILSYLKKGTWLYDYYASIPTIEIQKTVEIPKSSLADLSRSRNDELYSDEDYWNIDIDKYTGNNKKTKKELKERAEKEKQKKIEFEKYYKKELEKHKEYDNLLEHLR